MATEFRRGGGPRLRLAVGAIALVVLAGCAGTRNRAPVEDRAGRSPASIPLPPAAGANGAPAEPVKLLPGAENAGKPGYYSVRPGDTLIRIGLDNGQNWKDLVRWNNLDNPNVIEVGQVLRVVAPNVDPSVASTRPVAGTRAETKPGSLPDGAAAAASAAAASAPAVAVLAPPPTAPAARDADDGITWAWPAAGSVSTPFEEGKAKGLVINGKPGDPVFAAADGRVVYAGSGLRGYGNLIILKHNNTYLTAYAHNQALLVKEDQTVRRGQKIAEMGATDAERVQLHFEIRKQGKPIDPSRLLPPR